MGSKASRLPGRRPAVWRSGLLAALLAVPAAAGAQAPSSAFPTATTLDALTAYPIFYHLKVVTVRGQVTLKDGQARLVPPGGVGRGVDLIFSGNSPSEGAAEVRGQFFDIGELSADDPHVATLDIAGFVRARIGDRWPAHGELLAVNVASLAPIPPPAPRPSLRLLSLDPARYNDQPVTLTGQFGGRNLLGDLPQAPRISPTDFVLRAGGGAVWVTGLAPHGRGWQLNASTKADTDQWLQVEGIVHYGSGLVWIDAKRLSPVKPDAGTAEPAEAAIQVLPPPPPQVVFTLPAQDETDVSISAPVRIQTSRDLDPASLDGHIKVSYLGQAPAAGAIAFKARFDRDNRVLEIAFDPPLERFRTVKVDLDGIKGTDGQPLAPFSLTFSVGG